MHIAENNGTYTAQHVTGPTHNLLRLELGRGTLRDFNLTVLPAIGECRHPSELNLNEVKLAIRAGLLEANKILRTDYTIESAAIVENDTWQRGIYEYLTLKIVQKAGAQDM